MFAPSFMPRLAGVAALGVATSFGISSAMGQEGIPSNPAATNVYSPPPPQSSVYHPLPVRAYDVRLPIQPTASPRFDQSIVSESEPWWQEKGGRLAILAVFTAIMLLMGGGTFWIIHSHKDEDRPEAKND